LEKKEAIDVITNEISFNNDEDKIVEIYNLIYPDSKINKSILENDDVDYSEIVFDELPTQTHENLEEIWELLFDEKETIEDNEIIEYDYDDFG